MSVKRNFSAKREAIYKVLSSTKSHPTAEWVYEQLKLSLPDLSLGTVYRNINIFREMGIAKSVGVFNGHERYDANMSPHSHFICNSCFKIIDIPNGRNFVNSNIYSYIENQCHTKVESHIINFYGLCSECSADLKGKSISFDI